MTLLALQLVAVLILCGSVCSTAQHVETVVPCEEMLISIAQPGSRLCYISTIN